MFCSVCPNSVKTQLNICKQCQVGHCVTCDDSIGKCTSTDLSLCQMCFLCKYYTFPFQQLPDDEFVELNTNKENKDHIIHEVNNFDNVLRNK